MTRPIALEDAAELLRILGHGVRLALVESLASGELSVGELEARTGIGQPGLSQQLAVLRKAGLVATRRAGKQVHYRIERGRIGQLGALLDRFGGVREEARPRSGRAPARGGTAATFARIERIGRMA